MRNKLMQSAERALSHTPVFVLAKDLIPLIMHSIFERATCLDEQVVFAIPI